MCPDRELLSAYADGEVPSPWKERIAEHLASCEACSAAVERYASLGARLRAQACPGEDAIVARVRARLEGALASRPAAGEAGRLLSSFGAARPDSSWHRRISLPLPVAAAAAAAILFFAGLAASTLLRPARNAPPTLAAAEVIPSGAQPVSMDGILRYLDSQNAQVTLTINLPSETTFGEPGMPVIVRAPRANQSAVVSAAPQAPAVTPSDAAPVAPAGADKAGTP